MRLIFAVVFAAGLALAGLAASMVKSYMGQQNAVIEAERAVAAERVDVVEVYALRHAVAYGDRIGPDDLGVIQYAKPFLPEGTFSNFDDIFPDGEDVQRMVVRPMEALEPLMAVKVTEPGATVGLVTKLAKGMRAFTIRTDVSSGVSGFLRPGDHVDVYWSGIAPGTQQEVTRLIKTGLEIIAIDQSANEMQTSATIASTVTVQASAQDVASLAQAQSSGRLSLALVGMGDDTVSEVIEVDQNTLFGIEASGPVAERAPEKICTVRTRKGAEIIEIEVPCLN